MEREAQRDLSILNEIAEGGPVTQRSIAQRLDIALGLANLYLKRLVRKGYIKITTIPASRVRYLVTPKGLAEKTRLTYEYMEYSLHLYRAAREALHAGVAPYMGGRRRVAIYGTSEAAELAYLTLRELGLDPVAVIGEDGRRGEFLGFKVRPLADVVSDDLDCVIVASFRPSSRQIRALTEHGIPKQKIIALRGGQEGLR